MNSDDNNNSGIKNYLKVVAIIILTCIIGYVIAPIKPHKVLTKEEQAKLITDIKYDYLTVTDKYRGETGARTTITYYTLVIAYNDEERLIDIPQDLYAKVKHGDEIKCKISLDELGGLVRLDILVDKDNNMIKSEINP